MRIGVWRKALCLGFTWIVITFALLTFSYPLTLEKGKLYFIGVGPAGPEIATLQAIDAIEQADVMYAPNFIGKAFEEYLQGKVVRVAWPDSVYTVGNKP